MSEAVALLRVEHLCAGYGPRRVLQDISLEVGAHETVALVGANGAGKTTLMRSLLGLLRPTSGQLLWNGSDKTKTRADVRVRLGMALSPEGRLVCPDLKVSDNIRLGAHAFALSRKEMSARLEEMFALFAPLQDKKDQVAGVLSGGEQQMVAMARALIAKPRLLLLDEPTLGLSPVMVEQLFAIFRVLQQQGVAILMAEQQAGAALGLASRGYVLASGAIVQQGPAAALAADANVRRAFLGGV